MLFSDNNIGYLGQVFDVLLAVQAAARRGFERRSVTSSMDVTAMRTALKGELQRLGPTPAAGFDGGSDQRVHFDANQDGPAAYLLLNLVAGHFATVGEYTRATGVKLTGPVTLVYRTGSTTGNTTNTPLSAVKSSSNQVGCRCAPPFCSFS